MNTEYPIEMSVFDKTYIRPSKEKGINDIQLTAVIIYELHKIPRGKYLSEDQIIDIINDKFEVPDNKIREVLYTLRKQFIISSFDKIAVNELSYNIHEFSFSIQKVNEEFNAPWHSF